MNKGDYNTVQFKINVPEICRNRPNNSLVYRFLSNVLQMFLLILQSHIQRAIWHVI
jgi:hypothetical protein